MLIVNGFPANPLTITLYLVEQNGYYNVEL